MNHDLHHRSERRKRALLGCVGTALLIMAFAAPARAGSGQFWPEVDTFVKLNDRMRLLFLATLTRENRESSDGEFGPNLDIHFKALRNPQRWGPFRVDESKSRFLTLRVGYRFMPSFTGNSPDEHRAVLEVTPRYPLVSGVLVSDRSRMDFRFVSGDYSWRYRNRLTLEREFSAGRLVFSPYARAELYYDSRVDRVSRVALTGGVVIPIVKHIELESYFEHQNDSGGSSNRQVNAVGAVLNLYF